jgi:hypothetical protein
MTATDTIKAIQTLLGVTADGDFGPQSQAALLKLDTAIPSSTWPPVAPTGRVLTGDGSYPWTAQIDGADIVVTNARATCWGGPDDPQDDGSTASGISTKANPDLQACSLPMNYTGEDAETRASLIGSPIPMMPWKTMVRVTDPSRSMSVDVPVIDLGPGKTTGNSLDLTTAAARYFVPNANPRNFALRCTYRILGGAQYVGSSAA